MPIAGEKIGVGRPQGAVQQPIAHRPAVHEQILMGGVPTIVGGEAGIARQPDAFPLVIDRQGVGCELPAQNGGQARKPTLRSWRLGDEPKNAASVEIEREAHRLAGHGGAFDLLRDRHGLGARRLHELQSGRRGVKEIAHLDAGAVRSGEGGRRDRAHGAALNGDGMALVQALAARGDVQARDCADRGQGLPAKTERGDAQKVEDAVRAGTELRGRMALYGQRQLIGRQTRPVISHQDARQASAVRLDLQLGGPGVEGVLHQLLHRAGRTLHHLAGGDAVHEIQGQAVNGHGLAL